MQPDDELCLCFHVSWRKVINYIRVHKVRKASLLSQCQGAGTGCGWCRVFMERLVEHIDPSQPHRRPGAVAGDQLPSSQPTFAGGQGTLRVVKSA